MQHVGVKTSEFWIVVFAGIITAAGNALHLPEAVISWLNALALAWLTSRTVVKVVASNTLGKSIKTLPAVIFLLGMVSYLSVGVFLFMFVFKR